MDTDTAAFRDILAQAKRIVVIAGAGLSAASGLETFRGKGGLWEKHDVLKLVTPAAFIDNPSRIWQFHHSRRERMFKAVPNAAHIALAHLALPDLRHKLAPNSSFTIVTQNIDGLDRRAIDQVYADAGLPSPFPEPADSDPIMIEMHGHTAGVRCTKYECQYRGMNFDSPICPSLAGKEFVLDDTTGETVPAQGDATGSENAPRRPKRTAAEARAWAEARLSGAAEQSHDDDGIPVSELPRCPKCSGLLRPDVVWFTEVPPRGEEVVQIVEKADLCLVVGTSAVVHPAATFAAKVQDHGGKVAIFNIEPGKRDSVADFVFLGPCEEILPKVLAVPDAGV